jgi:hypothetical protein
MKFRLPSGELRWISIFWAVCGGAAGIYMLAQGNQFLAGIGFFVLAMTLGIWFQIRGCAWTLLALYLLSAVIILIREVIIAHEWLRIGKVLINIWFSCALFKWLSNPEENENH